MRNKIDDGEHKEENSQHQHGNESVINKIKEEEAFIRRFISMNFQQEVIKYVIGTITSCGKKVIELEK